MGALQELSADLDAQERTLRRDDLIKAGTLTAEAQELRFTIPGMVDYVLAQA